MLPQEIIRKKRDGATLSAAALEAREDERIGQSRVTVLITKGTAGFACGSSLAAQQFCVLPGAGSADAAGRQFGYRSSRIHFPFIFRSAARCLARLCFAAG